MRCPRCQKNNLSWADYCVSCGSRLTPVVVTRAGSSEANGLPEMRRHIDEIAVRLTNVEGRVTLISQRIGLEAGEDVQAAGEPEKAAKAEPEPEVLGESFPVEALQGGKPAAAPRSGLGLAFSEAPTAPAVMEKSQEESRIAEPDGQIRAEAPLAARKELPESEVAGSAVAEPVKPVLETIESVPAETIAPEIAVSSPPAEAVPVTGAFLSMPNGERAAATSPAAGTVPAKSVMADSKAAEVVTVKPGGEELPAKPVAASSQPPKEPAKPREPSLFMRRMRKWEEALPGNWLSRVGMLVLFIGLSLLTHWAYVNDKLVRLPLLLVGLACGGALLFVGHHWRERYGAWAQAVTGGGIGVLYLSVFASYALYVDDPNGPVMPFWATFSLMFLVTVLAVGIALRRNSMSIAILGIVGAFLVPVTLGAIDRSGGGAGGNNTGLLIAYVLTLDAGVVWLASLRNWRWFTLLGFVGSMSIFSLWYCTSDRDSVLGPAEGLLTGIFLCFAGATTLFHGLQRRRPQLTDLALMTLNAAVYFGVSHYLLWKGYQNWLGALGFGLAAFYAILGYLFLRRSKENSLLAAFAFGIAITFLTVAIPVQLEKSYMTAAWAAEGAVLMWLAVRYGTPRWQLWGLGAFALVLVRLFAFDQFVDREQFTPVLNDMFWAFALSVVAFYAGAWFLRHKEKALQPWFFPMMIVLANFLTVWLFSSEIVNFAGSRMILAHVNGIAGYDFRSIENARNLALVALWGVYGLAVVCVGARKNWLWLRLGGYALMGMAVGTTLVALNYLHAMIRNGASNPIANYSFGALAVCVCVLSALAYLIRRYGDRITAPERIGFPVVASLSSILTIYALSAEAFTFMGNWDVRNLVVAALWAAYGLGVLIIGVWRGWPWLRAQGWLLLLMAVGMTVVALNYGHLLMKEAPAYPIGNLSFGAFAICIAVIGAFAYLVSAYGKRLDRAERSAFPILVSAASILAIYAFSSEVVTFVDHWDVRNLVLVALWAAYGLGAMIVGLWRSWGWLRAQGWLLGLVAVGTTALALNYGHLLMKVAPEYPIGNVSFGAFAICIGMVTALASLVASNRQRFHSTEAGLFPVLVLAANLLVIWTASLEVITFVRGSENARNLVLVAIWCAYALALLAAGIRKNWDWLRMAGYLLTVLAVGGTLALLNHGHAILVGEDYMPILNPSLGGFAICVAALYFGAYALARNREHLHDFEGVVCILALAGASVLTLWGLSEEIVTFLDWPAVENLRNLMLVVLWLGYGCLLMAIGAARKALLPRIGAWSLLVIGVGVTAILMNHWHAGIGREEGSWSILNFSFGSFAVCILASYLFAYLTARSADGSGRFDRMVCAVALGLANVLTVWLLSAEVIRFVVDDNLRNMVLVVVWSGYGLLMMLAGAWKGIHVARFAGYALVAAAIGMTTTMLNHVTRPGLQRPDYNVVLNPSFGGFLVCVVALYAIVYLISRNSSKLFSGERIVLPLLVVAANALSLFALSSEVWTYAPEGSGQSMGLTVLWATYGVALVVVGILGKRAWVRLGGLALVAVAVLKLFIVDTLGLEPPYRVAAYITVGVLLLAGGFVYHRYADVIKGFIMDRPEKEAGSCRK